MELKVRIGEPVKAGRLTLVPLLQTSHSVDGGYLPGPVAEDQHLITVTERAEGASVPELDVIVSGHLPVLLIEGEMLIGQLQNRVLNVSVLVAAAARTPIPVSCVEAGRWGDRRTTGRGERHAPTKLRGQDRRRESQPSDNTLGAQRTGSSVGRGRRVQATRSREPARHRRGLR